MSENEIKALIYLLDDDDQEILSMVEKKIVELGDIAIPFLEEEWERTTSDVAQKRIENIISNLQNSLFISRLENWKQFQSYDLLEGLWILNTYVYPNLSGEKLKAQIEQLYYEAWLEFKPSMHPFEQTKVLNYTFFEKFKFVADTQNFYVVSNYMLNQVIDSRRGNPLTLCIIYMLIARKLHLPIYGISLPNIFALTFFDESIQFFINIFHRGLIFTREDVLNYLKQINVPAEAKFFTPSSNTEILKLFIQHLILSFQRSGETNKVKELSYCLTIL